MASPRERKIETLHISNDRWSFFRNDESGCFVGRRAGDEDRAHVGTDYEQLKDTIAEIMYGDEEWRRDDGTTEEHAEVR